MYPVPHRFLSELKKAATKTIQSATRVMQVGKGGGPAPQEGLSSGARGQRGAKQGYTYTAWVPAAPSQWLMGRAKQFCMERLGCHRCYICPIL